MMRSNTQKKRLVCVTTLVVTLWLGVMGHLLKTEWHQYQIATSARSPIDAGAYFEPFDSWMEIFYKENKIGFSHTSLTAFTGTETELIYSLSHRSRLNIVVLGEPQSIELNGYSLINNHAAPKSFSFFLKSDDYRLQVKGTFSATDLNVIYRTEHETKNIHFPIKADTLFSEDLNFLLSRQTFKEGETGAWSLFDPLSMDMSAVTYRVEDIKDKVAHLKLSYKGLHSEIWIRDDGHIEKEINPLGWVMMASDRARALETSGSMIDMIQAVAVPLEGDLSDVDRRESARFALMGVPDEFGLADFGEEIPYQKILTENNILIAEIVRPEEEEIWQVSVDRELLDKKWDQYLEPELMIESDDPDLKSLSLKIIGDERDAWASAQLLARWVYETLEKRAVVSIPSAKDVYRMGYGDCNEHTVLFTALVRAAGIPAMVHVGLVYLDGKFYYHAWPSVYIGMWVMMDPTLGQMVADVSHLTLITGSIEKHGRIAGLVNRIQIELLEERSSDILHDNITGVDHD